METTAKQIVNVYCNNEKIAILGFDSRSEKFTFSYEDDWKRKGFEISPNFSFERDITSATIKRFLDNLLPEGEGLEDLILSANLSRNNTFGMIMTIANETSGSLSFGMSLPPDEPIFREISDEELSARIAEIDKKSISIWDKKVRLSLAGVQAKLPLFMNEGKMGLADGSLASTHILKFQTKKYSNIVINEFFCMRLAKLLSLNVAEVALRYFDKHPVLIVQRFDRIHEGERVKRIQVLDGCQMLDVPPSYKYERNFGSNVDVQHIREGVSFHKLFELSKICEAPIVAKKNMLEWSIYNLIIGNCDAHGKNISFFITDRGIRVTPFYDLLAVMMYEEFDQEVAMAFGDEFELEKIAAYDLKCFAEEIDVPIKLISSEVTKMCKKMQGLLETEFIEIKEFSNSEKAFINNLKDKILQRVKYFKEHASLMLQI